MSRYRKIEVRTWSDERFRALSPMPPSAQGLWFFLLTGPHTSPIPGLFRAGRAGMAEELGWEQEAFDKAFAEVFREGMAKADFKARLVWLPNALKHNKPESPNVVRSWRAEFDLLPECDIKEEALEAMKAFIYGLGEGFAKAFDEAFPSDRKPSSKPLPKAMPNQEQEQEQEQEQTLLPAASLPPPPKIPPQAETALQAACRETWAAYSVAYAERYGVPPTRDVRASSQTKQIVQSLGRDEAPQVAAWFVGHPGSFYVTKGHAIGLLLADVGKLRTEWATGRVITAGKARQSDRAGTTMAALAEVLAERGEAL